MEKIQKLQSRKNFLLLGAAAFSSVTLSKFFGRTKKKKSETVKMLAQDGKLVEIDKELLSASRKKITNSELQHWIKTNKNND